MAGDAMGRLVRERESFPLGRRRKSQKPLLDQPQVQEVAVPAGLRKCNQISGLRFPTNSTCPTVFRWFLRQSFPLGINTKASASETVGRAGIAYKF